MPTFDFVCLDCGEAFTLELEDPPGPGRTRCSRCGASHVRQTFESYLRNALASPHTVDLEELRSCHFG